MSDWEWLAHVDPDRVERERFNIPNVGVLRNREGIHRGEIHKQPTPVNLAVIRAVTREREREDREAHRAVVRGELRGQIRRLENQLARERRQHERDIAWQKKLRTIQAPPSAGLSRKETA